MRLPVLASHHRAMPWLGICLAALLVAGAASALAADISDSSGRAPSAPAADSGAAQQSAVEQEPIAAIPDPPVLDAAKTALGERLFADSGLSGDGRRSCQSCHDIHGNGAGHLRFENGVDAAPLKFNTLTVFNAALSFRLGWEGKLRTLEAQAEASLDNPNLMATQIDQVIERLRARPEIVQQFRPIYGTAPDRASLVDAIATYERSLSTPGSRFDRWLGGDDSALSPEERHGYGLFKSLGCISCHQGVNVGGNLLARPGIFRPLTVTAPPLLRVPSLRNVATTAPYFHDGSAATLGEAVRRMASAQLDHALTDPEVDAIVAFLNTLTGTFRDAPVRASGP